MITKLHHLIVATILIFMFTISALLAWQDSLTFDEIAHIPAGYSYVTQHDYRLNPEHPPLLKILSGLALIPLHPHFDTTASFWTTANNYGEFGQWDAGRHLLHQANTNTDQLTFFARLPLIILAVAFAYFMFYWGRHIGGIITGLFAMILFVFDPNVLGHDHYVTTDIGIAAAIGIAFFFFLRFLKKPSWKNAIIGGVVLGIAQVTKFSAIMLIPFFGILLVIYPLIAHTTPDLSRWKFLLHYLFKGIVALLIMFFMIWLVYLPVTYRMPETVLPQIADIKGQPDKYPRDAYLIAFIKKTNEHVLTRPIATYTQGVMQVFNRVDDGNVSYFFGTVSSDASPWYFPFVFVTKQNIFHLMFYMIAMTLGTLGIVRMIRAMVHQSFMHSIHRLRAFVLRRFHEIALGCFVIFYAYISITGNLTIGFRHLFPMMPLLYILTAKTIIDSYKSIYDTKKKRMIKYVFITMIAALMSMTVTVFPYYVSYFNFLCGGPKNGYKYVTDSNADWGQDLKRLKTYLDQHPEIDKVRIDYFGGDDVTHRIGNEKFIAWWGGKRPVEPGYYAISALLLQESIYRSDIPDDSSYRWTQKMTPFAQIGTSILLFKVDAQ